MSARDPGTAGSAEAAHRLLDERAAAGDVPDAVCSWGVDPTAGVVIVDVAGPRTVEVDRFLAGVDPGLVRVVPMAAPPRRL